MLEEVLKLYTTAMAGDVRSPVPHLFGPPGCGKSSTVEEAAEILEVNLHIINVSRLSPLEVEGIQMPVDNNDRLHMIPAVFWTRLKEGDIVLFDEFLRGFPEVYNGLLDIFTSRRVGAFELPKVFLIAASNSTVAYDKALEDRLLHIPVPDPRKKKTQKRRLAELVVEQLGLLPDMIDSFEMNSLLDQEVLPMFEVLDSLGRNTASPATVKGHSLRHLIGQAQLRHVNNPLLSELLQVNNQRAITSGKAQFVLLPDGKHVPAGYVGAVFKLKDHPKLTDLQRLNIQLNLQLIELENAKKNKEGSSEDDIFANDEAPPF